LLLGFGGWWLNSTTHRFYTHGHFALLLLLISLLLITHAYRRLLLVLVNLLILSIRRRSYL
jgi:hypothetical protein